MRPRKPPASDGERLESAIAGLCEPLDADDASAGRIRARAEASGVDFAAWGTEIRAQARARVDAARRARLLPETGGGAARVAPAPERNARRTARRGALVAAVGLVAVLGVALALRFRGASSEDRESVEDPESIPKPQAQPGVDAGAPRAPATSAPRRRTKPE